MDKWQELKKLVEADLAYPTNYSSDKNYEHGKMLRVKEWMEQLEKREEKHKKKIGRAHV